MSDIITDVDLTTEPDISNDVPVNKDIAEVKAVKELTFDEKVNDLARFVQNEPLIRELDVKVLAYCATRKGLTDIEDQIAQYPEFKSAPRDQYHLVMELVDHYGLTFYELDEAGNPVTEDDKSGLSENEIDDLVASFAFETTEVGHAVAEMLDPQRRLQELLAIVPERYDTYIEILEFLREKHSFADVDSLLRGRAVLRVGRQPDDQAVQTSVFVDKLERVGAICFEAGWHITEAGEAFLSTLQAA